MCSFYVPVYFVERCLFVDVFQVNGVNLSEIQEGEVTVTNMHSSNGPDFILHMTFTQKTTGNLSSSIITRI